MVTGRGGGAGGDGTRPTTNEEGMACKVSVNEKKKQHLLLKRTQLMLNYERVCIFTSHFNVCELQAVNVCKHNYPPRWIHYSRMRIAHYPYIDMDRCCFILYAIHRRGK